MRSEQRAFTLIELMVVIGVLGILTSIAVPVYKDYALRAKVAEGLQLAAAAKLAVAEDWQSKGALPNNNSAAGLPTANQIRGHYVRSISVAGSGTITVTYSAAEPAIHGKTVSLIPETGAGGVRWECSSATMASRYLPPNCR